MKKFKITTKSKKMLADTFTPVSIYLKLRDKFVNTLLLESADYHAKENALSYLCCDAVASFEVSNQVLTCTFPDGSIEKTPITDKRSVAHKLQEFARCFENAPNEHKFNNNGLFGYMTYDAVQYFEDIELQNKADKDLEIPLISYQVFRYVVVINHFNNELFIFEHQFDDLETPKEAGLDYLETLIRNKNFAEYGFTMQGSEESNCTDDDYLKMVKAGKQHCFRGDVFQIVLSRRFQQSFQGDEFNVYRALRSINPSPYLFYFDYGNYKIFGSSPEAQLVVKKDEAIIYPIAGTFKRTGNDAEDAAAALSLYNDEKETAEHIMLVDLARNDLSKHCDSVRVEKFKEVQYFSHVIHLTSTVKGHLNDAAAATQIVADTFPAGTLSGAPKHRAMTLIDQYEKTNRSFYGGCIGFMGFDGDFNHAITIRSFLSKNNTLYYQAGAGIVSKSVEESELNEVHHKLRALRKALQLANGGDF